MASWYQPESDPLKGDVAKAAYQGQLKYPRIVRERRDPIIINQNMALISFLRLPEEKDGVTYFAKVRGVYPDETTATDAAKKIIREVDSKHEILFCNVGTWFPVTDKSKYVKSSIDCKMDDNDEEEKTLNDEAVKEAENEHNRIRKEIKNRAEELRNPKNDPYADLEGLDYYVMKKVSIISYKGWIREQQKKLEDLQNTKEDLEKLVAELTESHPEYSDQWLDRYNEKRKESGLEPYHEGDEERNI